MIGALTSPDGPGAPASGSPRIPEADVLALWRAAFDAARVVTDDGAPSTDMESERHAASEHEPARRRGDRQGAALDERAAPGGQERPAADAPADAAARPDGVGAPERGDAVEAAGDAAGAFPAARAHAPAAAIDEAVADRAAGATPALAQAGARGRIATEAARAEPGVERTLSLPVAAERSLPRRAEATSREATASRPLRLPSEPDTLPPPESVRVYQGAHGLQVVVRHVGLAPQSAVWCALETARQLAGDRRALQQVTLNGRSVYEGPAVEPQSTPAAAAVVLFTC
jgi:hypothetical protein